MKRREFITALRGVVAECRTFVITLPVYCCVGISSAQAIECLR
jgi:hypothetical protein